MSSNEVEKFNKNVICFNKTHISVRTSKCSVNPKPLWVTCSLSPPHHHPSFFLLFSLCGGGDHVTFCLNTIACVPLALWQSAGFQGDGPLPPESGGSGIMRTLRQSGSFIAKVRATSCCSPGCERLFDLLVLLLFKHRHCDSQSSAGLPPHQLLTLFKVSTVMTPWDSQFVSNFNPMRLLFHRALLLLTAWRPWTQSPCLGSGLLIRWGSRLPLLFLILIETGVLGWRKQKGVFHSVEAEMRHEGPKPNSKVAPLSSLMWTDPLHKNPKDCLCSLSMTDLVLVNTSFWSFYLLVRMQFILWEC